MFIFRSWCLLISSVFLVVVVVVVARFVLFVCLVLLFLILLSYLFSFLEREAARDEILPTSSDNSVISGNKKRAPFKRLDRRE